MPSGSGRPSEGLQEHRHITPNALAHISAAGSSGIGSLSFWGNFHRLESVLLWRACYVSLLTSEKPSACSCGLLWQALYVFSVNHRGNGDASAFFYTLLQSSVVSILSCLEKRSLERLKITIWCASSEMMVGISRGGGFDCGNTQNSPKYSLLAVSFCRSPRCPVAPPSAARQSVEEKLIFCWAFQHQYYRNRGNILLFCLKTLKRDRWISPEFKQIFLPTFTSFKPELCEVMFLKDNFCGRRVALTSGYRHMSNSTTSSISCLHWKSRIFDFIFYFIFFLTE